MTANRQAWNTKRRHVDVPVPHIGDVRLQSLTHAERVECNRRAAAAGVDPLPYFIVAAAVDEHGNTLFTDADLAMLSDLDAAAAHTLDLAIAAHVMGLGEKKKPNGTSDCAESP